MVYSPNSLSNGKNYELLGVRDTIFSDKTMGEDLRVAGIATTILGVRILPGLSDGPTHGFLLTNVMNLNLKYVTLTHSIHSLYIFYTFHLCQLRLGWCAPHGTPCSQRPFEVRA